MRAPCPAHTIATMIFDPREHVVKFKGAHTRSIMLRKIVLRNTSLPINYQVNQHHIRSTSYTTRNVAQHD
jgi:hypothetical protein